MKGWIGASASVRSTDRDEFEEACIEAFDTRDAIFIRHDLLRVQVDGEDDAIMLLLALPDDSAQRCKVAPGLYEFPPGWEPELRRIVREHRVAASVVPAARFELDLRHRGLIDALSAALLRQAPVFGPTYPRIIVP